MGRIAIVTGGAAGIGAALARALVIKGDTVVVADIDVAQRSGHIVNTASLAGLVPAPGLTPYATTKHAIVGLSLSLRAEAAGYGVRVTAVCPGFVDTPLLDKGGPDDLPKTQAAQHGQGIGRQPLPRLYPADALAGDIVRGIDRNAALVIAPASARAAWFLRRYAPWVLNQQMARLVAKQRSAFAADANAPAVPDRESPDSPALTPGP